MQTFIEDVAINELVSKCLQNFNLYKVLLKILAKHHHQLQNRRHRLIHRMGLIHWTVPKLGKKAAIQQQ